MSRHIALAPHLSVADLEQRYRAAHEPHERSWWQILWLLAKGQTATALAESTGYPRYWIGQIAEQLFISPKTVDTHRTHIMDKLNLHSRAELVKYAMRRGVLEG